MSDKIQSRCGMLCEGCEFVQSMGCKGCVNIDKPFHGDCAVKTCCEGRLHTHCGECEEFPCELLKGFAFDTQYGYGDDRILRVCAKWAGIEYRETEKL